MPRPLWDVATLGELFRYHSQDLVLDNLNVFLLEIYHFGDIVRKHRLHHNFWWIFDLRYDAVLGKPFTNLLKAPWTFFSITSKWDSSEKQLLPLLNGPIFDLVCPMKMSSFCLSVQSRLPDRSTACFGLATKRNIHTASPRFFNLLARTLREMNLSSWTLRTITWPSIS